jgi:hypothetical protein
MCRRTQTHLRKCDASVYCIPYTTGRLGRARLHRGRLHPGPATARPRPRQVHHTGLAQRHHRGTLLLKLQERFETMSTRLFGPLLHICVRALVCDLGRSITPGFRDVTTEVRLMSFNHSLNCKNGQKAGLLDPSLTAVVSTWYEYIQSTALRPRQVHHTGLPQRRH